MHMDLVCKQQNNENIVDIQIFNYIQFIDSEKLKKNLKKIETRKNDKFLTFNIVHFPDFEISASL